MERVHVSELGAALENARLEVETGRRRCGELSSKLEESKSAAAASASRNEELAAALNAEHVRVENLLAQLVAAAEREKVLRTDLDLAHKTAASERKCVEAAIRKQRQTEKELEGARKDAEDLRVKVQKAKEQSKAAKGKGGLFQGASAADLAFLEQAARRELASARGRSASVPRPRSKALDVIDI
jgi:chromosome segregation ATPase